MPQITTVTSEALQAAIRRLLPSQQGFGIDLEASNVILPVIDITPTAEGSQLPIDLARALSFSSQDAFDINATTTIVAAAAGFYRCYGVSSVQGSSAANRSNSWKLKEGATTVSIWQHIHESGGINGEVTIETFDFTVFLDAAQELQGSADTACVLVGSVRQVADRYGSIQNPIGFTFE